MKEKFEFKPFEKVLVRDADGFNWRCNFFSHIAKGTSYEYACVGGMYCQCIPYEGNEHLLGTTEPYKEVYQPKDGDFVVSGYKNKKERVEWISIYKECEDNDFPSRYHFYASKYLNKNAASTIFYDSFYNNLQKYNRPATEEEISNFLAKLKANLRKWDAEQKKIVEIEWEPEYGEEYYTAQYTRCKFNSDWSRWCNDDVDNERKNRGLVFRTEELCNEACEKLNKALEDALRK